MPIGSQAIEGQSLHQMSDNVVSVMKAISSNLTIRTLLTNDGLDPFSNAYTKPIPSSESMLNPTSDNNKIRPVAFDMESTESSKTEIRVYYAMGRLLQNSTVQDFNMHIDIISSKDQWLIRDKVKDLKIRPYEIMSCIHDEIGRNNRHQIDFGHFISFQLLSVNNKYDALRIFFNTLEYTKNPLDDNIAPVNIDQTGVDSNG